MFVVGIAGTTTTTSLLVGVYFVATSRLILANLAKAGRGRWGRGESKEEASSTNHSRVDGKDGGRGRERVQR